MVKTTERNRGQEMLKIDITHCTSSLLEKVLDFQAIVAQVIPN